MHLCSDAVRREVLDNSRFPAQVFRAFSDDAFHGLADRAYTLTVRDGSKRGPQSLARH